LEILWDWERWLRKKSAERRAQREKEEEEKKNGFVEVTNKKRKKVEKVVDETNERTPKRVVCKSIREGVSCPHGDKCTYIHYLDEAEPGSCKYGYNCMKTKFGNGSTKNRDSKNPCFLIHPEETIKGYMNRIGVKGSMAKNLKCLLLMTTSLRVPFFTLRTKFWISRVVRKISHTFAEMATALIVILTMEHSDFTMTMKKSRLASQNTVMVKEDHLISPFK